MEKVIVKLGGSLITFKEEKYFPLTLDEIIKNADSYINEPVIKRLISEIYSARIFPLILVHGVGPFGHYLVKHQSMLSNKEIIHMSVAYLNERIVSYFKGLGIKIKSCAPFDSCWYKGNGEFMMYKLFNYGINVLNANGILATYGDIVPTVEGVQGNCEPYQVISGDDLMVGLADMWKAKKIIAATDVDGFFNKDPTTSDDAVLIKEVKSRENITISESGKKIDITGGMKAKVKKIQIAARSGIKGQIINGLKKDNLRKALLGDESIGTLILP